ncbi:MAG: PAS domain-containing protein [Betaproteobacteria bacterium]
MNVVSIARPDVTIRLDLNGVIQDVSLSNTLSHEDVTTWVGQRWVETVALEGGTKIRRMVEDAAKRSVSAFRQVTQRFPSGLELLIEYTTVRLGDGAGLIAVGKSLQAFTELQSRLLLAQQEMEREHWKLRELESHYQLLFDNTNEGVLRIRAASLQILEANPPAIRALGLSPGPGHGVAGRDFLAGVTSVDHEQVRSLLQAVSQNGKAPGALVHLGRSGEPWLMRASLMSSDTGLQYLVQLSPTGLTTQPPDPAPSIEDLVESSADGVVVLDTNGIISFANEAFLALVQADTAADIVGLSISRWLENAEGSLAAIRDSARDHPGDRHVLARVRGAKGRSVPVDLVVLRSRSPNARHIGVALLSADDPVLDTPA